MDSSDDSLPTTGVGTDPEADAKEAARARRLANLRPPFPPGQSGNPRGHNGRGRANEIAAFLDQPETIDANRTRFEAIVDRLFRAALRGNTLAAKVLIEYRLGKPGVPPDALAIAEHFRRVERDRVDLVLRMLGDRINTMDPKTELVPLIMECAANTRGFLDVVESAQQMQQQSDGEAIEVATAEQKQPGAEQAEYPGDGETPRSMP